MATRKGQRRYAFVLSVLAHAAMIVALTFSLPLGSDRQVVSGVVPIEAVMIDTAAIAAEAARLEEIERIAQQQLEAEQRAADERRRQQEAAEAAAAEAERVAAAEAAAEAERIRLQRIADEQAEADRLASIERQRLEAEQQAEQERLRREAEAREAQRLEEERLAAERAAEEQRRQEAAERARAAEIQAQVAASIAADQAARAAEESGLTAEWVRAIENKIRRSWQRPPSARPGLECVLAVKQILTGDVVEVTMQSCNGDEVVERSIIAAVERASPLPPPPVPEIFRRDLVVTFKPDE